MSQQFDIELPDKCVRPKLRNAKCIVVNNRNGNVCGLAIKEFIQINRLFEADFLADLDLLVSVRFLTTCILGFN